MDAVDVIVNACGGAVGHADAKHIVSALTASGHLQEWLPIDQYDPDKHGAEVDLWAAGVRETNCEYHQGKWRQWDWSDESWIVFRNVTHFRQIPNAPVEKE